MEANDEPRTEADLGAIHGHRPNPAVTAATRESESSGRQVDGVLQNIDQYSTIIAKADAKRGARNVQSGPRPGRQLEQQ